MTTSKKENFHNLQTISGILLFATAILAIILVNSPLASYYNAFFHTTMELRVAKYHINQSILHWINDGLMAIYFLLIGLEIKREVNRGILQGRKSVFIPAFTALCGLLLPALIYVAFNYHDPHSLRGWAIPTATDIAFTLGIVSLLKTRVPLTLKVLLTAIAMFDDIGAIAIIAIFYTKNLSFFALSMTVVCTLILFAFNRLGIRKISLYIVVGFILWVSVLESGVHATLAGIIIAMTIPDEKQNSTLTRLENSLHPWIVFLILPLFAFANAGISFQGFSLESLYHPIVLGIICGLFFGKQIGIFFPLWLFVKNNKHLRKEIKLYQIYGIALICGVGFTMSLFIGALAFGDGQYINLVKLGVFSGSIISALAGFLILRLKKAE